jgi:hypothetical protein
MDKKIISIFFLLIIVIAATVTYVAYNQISLEEKQQDYVPTDGDVTAEDIYDEIDDAFLSEDDEIEIGEMV